LYIIHFEPSALLGSHLSSSHTMAIPQPFTFLLY
jgi:hypothetical protein